MGESNDGKRKKKNAGLPEVLARRMKVYKNAQTLEKGIEHSPG